MFFLDNTFMQIQQTVQHRHFTEKNGSLNIPFWGKEKQEKVRCKLDNEQQCEPEAKTCYLPISGQLSTDFIRSHTF